MKKLKLNGLGSYKKFCCTYLRIIYLTTAAYAIIKQKYKVNFIASLSILL
jgi:hypothetical protein